ncbi:MAG: efflux RND transporter periplasmic adaptor subunit [Anaerolineae bacterium]|nr:efflux RND transporter periplasmic adaptor subunit [Anaerolineae bacterium]
MRRILLVLVVAAVIVAGGYWVWQQQQATAAEQKPNIRTATIDRGSLTLLVNANGNIAPERSVRLSFDAPGIVAEIDAKEGQMVSAGQILARQDDTAQRLAVEQAKANLNVAELSLRRLQAPPDPRDLAVAEAQVKTAEASYNALFSTITPAQIRAAEAQYNQAVAAYETATQRRKDTGGQYPTDSVPFQLALAQEGQASFNAEIARLQVQLLRRGPDGRTVAAAKAQIEASKARLDQLKAPVPQVQIDQATISIDQAKFALEQAERQLEKVVLTAPFSGVVSTIAIRQGALSVTGVPAIVLVDVSRFHVDVRVDEIDIGLLREGQPVALTVDALGGAALSGRVDRIALVADQSGTVTTYQVRMALDPTEAKIKAGMTVSAAITVQEVIDVVRVPNQFVRLDKRTNQAYVNLVNSTGTLTEIPIQLGLRTEEYSEVVVGLREGDTVGINLDAGGFSLFN